MDLRVAVVAPTPFGEDGQFGGGERHALELARALAKRVPTRLVLFGTHRETRMDGRLRIEIHPWIVLVRGVRHNPFGLGYLRSLFPVDVVHCMSWHTLMVDFSILLCRLLRKRVFIQDVGGGGSISLARLFDIGKLADGFLTSSDFSARQLALAPHRYRVVYAGARAAEPSAQTPRLDRLLFVGRLLPHKGIDILIKALPVTVPLTVIGRPMDIDYYNTLRDLSQKKLVTFVTDADDSRLEAEYGAGGILVQPSVYRTSDGGYTAVPELFGLTVAEAMMHGLPVIVSDAGSLPELVVNEETGIVVPQGNQARLTAAIERLRSDPRLGLAMGARGRDRALSRFTWNSVVDRCLEAYQAEQL